MMQEAFIIAKQVSVKHQQQLVLNALGFTMHRGEHWLLTGEAGSGKTTLAKVFAGQCFYTGALTIAFDNTTGSTHALYVPQWHHFTNHAGIKDFYYQQRYNSCDAEDAYTVLEDIQKSFPTASEAAIHILLEQFGIGHRIHSVLLLLSSGEQKKLQLAKAILTAPQLLILDNPYIGLDVASRRRLNDILATLAQEKGTQLVIISDAVEIPSCVTHVAVLAQQQLTVTPKAQFTPVSFSKNTFVFDEALLGDALYAAPANTHFSQAVHMENINISYGDKKILDQVNWTIRKGERWLLQGHNGAGKTTLLSLVTGDHPQAYANPLSLFDKRRGTGESIWDIKKKIGFVSPELHWYFDATTSCMDVLLSGFYDTTGLYRAATEEQKQQANAWLQYLQLQPIAGKLLSHVSVGQQRLLLLARAFIKNPPLLVLDEPFQGVDEQHAQAFIALIDKWMQHPERTLVYVTHRNDQMPACIEHVFKLEQGKHQVLPVTHLHKTTA
ncbi:molybdate transport system ATP-binding protein [Filimonas zeae]|uniref:Molybdenum ABC transporter ATP-binding protein n=1 Tax=Filimonas zeae TaxID=1737353 RepID=A0A917J3S9_9BACT|nr:ATP-binding cassette domain-containing protein [Filimonas zeae]MDR6342784.1 molybdate transport system ATP-binding protein [Filimonas zeae]GGH82693.1 molybdenum ABC transporter ATP-binding protein [Filimonas zeae]